MLQIDNGVFVVGVVFLPESIEHAEFTSVDVSVDPCSNMLVQLLMQILEIYPLYCLVSGEAVPCVWCNLCPDSKPRASTCTETINPRICGTMCTPLRGTPQTNSNAVWPNKQRGLQTPQGSASPHLGLRTHRSQVSSGPEPRLFSPNAKLVRNNAKAPAVPRGVFA